RLLDYHRREAKPVWWSFFDRLERTPEELVEDAEAIGALELVESRGDGVHVLRFPLQQHKLDAGDRVLDPLTGQTAGHIRALDDVAGTLELGRSAQGDER